MSTQTQATSPTNTIALRIAPSTIVVHLSIHEVHIHSDYHPHGPRGWHVTEERMTDGVVKDPSLVDASSLIAKLEG